MHSVMAAIRVLVVGIAVLRPLRPVRHVTPSLSAAVPPTGAALPPLRRPPSPKQRLWGGRPVESEVQLLHPHTDFAHRYWASSLERGDTVVDATTGNGHDLLVLARALGSCGGGTLHAWDLQQLAIDRSQDRMRDALVAEGWTLEEGTSRWVATCADASVDVHWRVGSHDVLLAQLPAESARLVVFNLGYLPGGDKSVVTRCDTTLSALRHAGVAVRGGGAVSVTIYPGHEEGVAEERAILEHASQLQMDCWSVYHTRWLNQRNKRTGSPAPSLLMLQKIW